MKKKFLLGISTLALGLAVSAAVGVEKPVVRTDAAFKNPTAHYEDNFSSFDSSSWSFDGGGFEMKDLTEVDVPTATITGFTANGAQSGYLRTDQKIRLGEGKSLVVEIYGSDWTSMIFLQGLRDNTEELATFTDGIAITDAGQFTGDGITAGGSGDTAWTGIDKTRLAAGNHIKFVLNADGTGRVDMVDAAGEKAPGAPGVGFTGLKYNRTGYWGLEGLNAFSIKLTKVIIGQQSADGTGYAPIFVSNFVPGHTNMTDHGNVRWGSQTIEFKNVNMQSKGKVHIQAYNYNDGYFSTKAPFVADEGKVVYYELDVENWSGDIGISDVSATGYVWPNFITIRTEENACQNNIGGATLSFGASGLWHEIMPSTVGTNVTFRFAIAPDGSGRLGVANADGTWYTQGISTGLCTGLHYATTGYFGIYGNGGSSNYDLVGLRVGQADDLELTNSEILMFDDMAYNGSQLCSNKLVGANSKTVFTNPVYGIDVHEMQIKESMESLLVYNGVIAADEGKLSEVSAKFNMSKFDDGSKVGFAFGVTDDNAKGNFAATVEKVGSDLKLGDTVLTGVTNEITMKASIYKNKVEVTVGDVTKTFTGTTAGKVALYSAGAPGYIEGTVKLFTFDRFIDVISRNISIDKFTEENFEWFYHRVDDSEVGKVQLTKDGKVEFVGMDGCYFGTKEVYANFELEADFEYKYDEDEEMVTSVWAGVLFGKDVEYAGCAWAQGVNAPMAYFSNTVVDFLNIPNAGRGWTAPENNPMQQGVNHIRLRAENGHVQLWLAHGNLDPAKVLDVENINHYGRVAFGATAGSNYSISKFKLTDLDHPENIAPTDSSNHDVAVEQRKTVTGTVTPVSAYGASVKVAFDDSNIKDQGTFTVGTKGSWSFKANADAVPGTYTVPFTMTDLNVVGESALSITINEHTHAPTLVDEVGATYYEDGVKAHYYCEECDQLLVKDASGVYTVVTEEDLVIPQLHEIKHVAAKDATCDQNGNIEYWYCSYCGEYYLDAQGTQAVSAEDVVIKAEHELEHVAAKAATCDKDGNVEYWYCSICDKYYADANAMLEVSAEAVVIKAGHQYKYVAKVDATEEAAGMKAHYVCELCGDVFIKDDFGDFVKVSAESLAIAKLESKGCSGSVVAASGIVSLVTLMGVGMMIGKKKEDK